MHAEQIIIAARRIITEARFYWPCWIDFFHVVMNSGDIRAPPALIFQRPNDDTGMTAILFYRFRELTYKITQIISVV